MAIADAKPQLSEEQLLNDRIEQVFLPVRVQVRDAYLGKKRFVHYTSVQAATSIIRNREVWMRNALCMNDISEVHHGLDCLSKAYKSDVGQRLQAAIESVHPGLMNEVVTNFDSHQNNMRYSTYLTCLSIHEDDEDKLGRLSMWRAYSGTTGVAIVMKSDPFFARSDALKAYSHPVSYLDDKGFAVQFGNMVDNIVTNLDWVKGLDPSFVSFGLFNAFMFSSHCTKHRGYLEEKEYRIIHCPRMYKSERLIKSVELIGDVPQLVYKIPLKNVPEEGLIGIEPAELLDRVIIGPTRHPWVTWEAIVELLREAEVPEPESKVVLSDIPLRC